METDFKDYLDSADFQLFMDETLRANACRAVENYCQVGDPVDTGQIRPIDSVIQAGGYEGLRTLVRRQREKNTKKKNKMFWNYIFDHVYNPSGKDPDSFLAMMREKLGQRLEDENVENRRERNRIKKENKALVNAAINKVLPVYFEHFCCHYLFYVNRKR